MQFRPALLGVDVEVEVARVVEGDFVGPEAVPAQEEVGLVESMFAGEAGGVGAVVQREIRGPGRLVGGEVDALELQTAVDRAGVADDVAVGLGGGADDELRGALDAGEFGALGGVFGHDLERGDDVGVEALEVGELREVGGAGHLDVEGDGVGKLHGAADRLRGGSGDHLEVDVAVVLVFAAQDLGCGGEQLHRVVRGADDAGGEEDAQQPLAAQIVHEDLGHLVRRQRAAVGGAVLAERTVGAVAGADVRDERLEHDARAAGGELDGVEPGAVEAAPPPRPLVGAAGAREVVFGVVRKEREFLADVESHV